MHNPPLILIADDEPDTSALLRRICSRAGFDVEISVDGYNTLEMASSILPDLILLDVQMPFLNGFEVVARLRDEEHTRQIPIIVITAAATKPEDAVRGIELGADDYILKPFNFHELVARIRSKLRAKELEENLQQRTSELETLVRLGVDLSRSHELTPLVQSILTVLKEEFKSSVSLVSILDAENCPALALRQHPDGSIETIDPQQTASYLDQCDGAILDSEQSAKLFSDDTITNSIIMPLTQDDATIGMIAIGRKAENPLGRDELRLMESVSRQAALAIRNGQLYESLRVHAGELENRVLERTRELQSAQEQLIRSEKLASLGRLAGEIAHEINNPLQPIMMCIEGALEDSENERSVDPQDLRTALSEVTRLKRTVTRLLDFARPDSGGVVKTDINEVIQEVLALVRKKLQHTSIELVTHFQPMPKILSNPDQIKQVLLNVAINAIDAIDNEENGTLTLKLSHDDAFVHIEICDNGQGIPEDLLPQIFEPFFSTKESGSGLGLAVSHSIIEAHGGKFDVQSKSGQGTDIKISLPVH